jgi:hypothetical protein
MTTPTRERNRRISVNKKSRTQSFRANPRAAGREQWCEKVTKVQILVLSPGFPVPLSEDWNGGRVGARHPKLECVHPLPHFL